MKHQSVLFSLFKRVIVNSLNWLRALESMVMKKVKIKISFTSRPLEPEFYNDLVYKFKKIMYRTDFSDQFKKITIHHKCIGYHLNVMRQCVCFVTNPICCTL